jgi:MinD-like ATPase involved in chromosome partitioning or flagellar assembly
LGKLVLEFVAAGSEVFLVATPEPTSLTDSYSLLKALCNYEGFSKEYTQIKVIANKDDLNVCFYTLKYIFIFYIVSIISALYLIT